MIPYLFSEMAGVEGHAVRQIITTSLESREEVTKTVIGNQPVIKDEGRMVNAVDRMETGEEYTQRIVGPTDP